MASENETTASVADCIRHMADNMPNVRQGNVFGVLDIAHMKIDNPQGRRLKVKIETKHRKLGKKTEAILNLLELSEKIHGQVWEIQCDLCDGYGDKEMNALIGKVLVGALPEFMAMEIIRLCNKRVMGGKK